jgi:hypothetical protein
MKKVKPVKKLRLDPIKLSQLSTLKGGNRHGFATDLTSCQPSCFDCSVVCPTDICPSKFNKCDPAGY